MNPNPPPRRDQRPPSSGVPPIVIPPATAAPAAVSPAPAPAGPTSATLTPILPQVTVSSLPAVGGVSVSVSVIDISALTQYASTMTAVSTQLNTQLISFIKTQQDNLVTVSQRCGALATAVQTQGSAITTLMSTLDSLQTSYVNTINTAISMSAGTV